VTPSGTEGNGQAAAPSPADAATDESPRQPDFPVVAIGASAGGLGAMQRLFDAMPAAPGMAFVVIQHLDPTHTSYLSNLLARHTAMCVQQASEDAVLAPDTVHVIPPGVDMTVAEGRLHLSEPEAPAGRRHPIDLFLRSLAVDVGARAVAIILSGTGTEGVLGVREIKAAGGLVLVQEPTTAEYDGMPENTRASGLADFVLEPEAMPRQLAACTAGVAEGPVANDPADHLTTILGTLRDRTGHDLSLYKQSTIVRRIERRMVVHGIETLADYVAFLHDTPGEARTLLQEALIGVSSFFRDPDAFTALRRQVLAPLVAERQEGSEIRMWVPGCASGEEAYSLAILLTEEMARQGRDLPVQIFGTDIDPEAVERARAGVYPASIATDVPDDLLRRHFRKDGDHYRVRQGVRDMLIFAEQNVIRDAPFSRLDLISCRNLLIYLTPRLQRRLLPVFHYALRAGGHLLLGASEAVSGAEEYFDSIDRKWKLYRRRDDVGARAVVFPHGAFTAPAARRPALAPREAEPQSPGFKDVTEAILLAEHAPPAVVANGNGDLLYVHGRTGRFLEPASGDAKLNVVLMAREGLRVELSAGLRRALQENRTIRYDSLVVRTNGDTIRAALIVRPITDPPAMEGLALVVFEPLSQPAAALAEADGAAETTTDERVEALERALHDKEEHLQSTIEELESSNEELRSTNEELQSANEELQSTNEEHETTKEELQSANEELSTVNAELETKVRELSKANDDMANLLATAEIGTLFLDTDVCVKRFTPVAATLLNLRDSDIGRPLEHLATNLDYDTLVSDCRAVLDDLVPRGAEARAPDGTWYAVRILPYRTVESVMNGLVVTLADITDRKELEADSRLAAVVRDCSDAVTVQDFDGAVLAWNRGAEVMYGYTEAEAKAMSVFTLMPEEVATDHRRLLRRVARDGRAGPVEARRRDRDGRSFTVRLTATLLPGETGADAVATAESDITDEKRRLERLNRFRRLYEAAPQPIVVEDTAGAVAEMNEAARRRFGDRAGARIAAADRDAVAAARQRVVDGGAVERRAASCLDADGTAFRATLTLVPLGEGDDGVDGVAVFYTESPGMEEGGP